MYVYIFKFNKKLVAWNNFHLLIHKYIIIFITLKSINKIIQNKNEQYFSIYYLG